LMELRGCELNVDEWGEKKVMMTADGWMAAYQCRVALLFAHKKE
jgi:hypothetical protein